MKKNHAAVCIALFLVGILPSALSAKTPKLTGTEKIAIVNYSIEKSIMKAGDEPDKGPGLLNKEEEYYKYHREGLTKAWAVFLGSAPSIFGETRLIDLSTIVGNQEIMTITAPKSRKILGVETSPASMFLYPEGLNYLSIFDAKITTQLAKITGADLLVSVEIKADYDLTDGIGINKLTAGKGKMTFHAKVTAVTPNGKFFRSFETSGTSEEKGTILGAEMSDEEYPRLMESAQKALTENLAKEFALW